MGVINHLNSSGHTAVVWDPADAVSTAKAADEFLRLRNQGNLLLETKEGIGQGQVREFNPDAEEILAVRPLQGG